MNIEVLLTFTIGMMILAATPGPGVFASVSKAIGEGFKASLFFIGGLVLGDIVFLILALIGMSAIAHILGNFFFLIKILGGFYLIYMGIKMIKSKTTFNLEKNISSKGSKNFLAGFLITLGNPKAILFYASVVPTIIDLNNVNVINASAMAAIIALVSFTVVGTYCYLASLSRNFINDKNSGKIGKVSGTVLSITGGYLIIK